MAEDVWESVLHECRYGGLRIDVLSLSDDVSRALAVHKYVRREGGDVEDLGGEPRTTRCRVLFFEHEGHADARAQNHIERFRAFVELVRKGKAQTFTHPITGSYRARVGAFTFDADAERRDQIAVDVEFTEDTTEPAVFELGSGMPLLSGAEEVAAAADAADAEIAAAGLEPSTVGGESISAAESWESDTEKTVREVNLELAGMSNKIAAELDRYEVATNVDRYPVMTSLQHLNYTLRKAAQAFTDRTPRLIEITVRAPVPLLTLCARTYGGDLASERFDDLMRLNDIHNPARIEAGTVLKAQAPDTPRARLRSPT